MHIEILVEDSSGKEALEILMPKIVGVHHSFRIHPYKGTGRIPKGMRDTRNASKRILFENLPKLLKGYGQTFKALPSRYGVAVVCDLDDKNKANFLRELNGILARCNPKPNARFCLAIEEGEAWLLGDMPAVRAAFPNAKKDVLDAYVNDSICGTWELLANAIYPGGARALSQKGYQAIGAEKTKWARSIGLRMAVENNVSPSFCNFRDEMRSF